VCREFYFWGRGRREVRRRALGSGVGKACTGRCGVVEDVVVGSVWLPLLRRIPALALLLLLLRGICEESVDGAGMGRGRTGRTRRVGVELVGVRRLVVIWEIGSAVTWEERVERHWRHSEGGDCNSENPSLDIHSAINSTSIHPSRMPTK